MADGTAKRIEGGRGQVVLFVIWRLEKQNSASAWRVTMAPRQLRLEPVEVDTAADKGAKRVRVESTDESSTQVQLRPRAIAWGTSWLCPAHCWLCLTTGQSSGSRHGKCVQQRAKTDPFGSRSTPLYYHSFGCLLQHPPGGQPLVHFDVSFPFRPAPSPQPGCGMDTWIHLAAIESQDTPVCGHACIGRSLSPWSDPDPEKRGKKICALP
eukprot:scaffold19989_cov112-Isochrysis_galbana.AAC.5